MRVCLLNCRPVLDHIALGANHNGRANRSLHFLAIHHLLAERAVFFHDFGFGVRQQHVGQLILLGKLVVRLDGVFADAKNDNIFLFE